MNENDTIHTFENLALFEACNPRDAKPNYPPEDRQMRKTVNVKIAVEMAL